MSAHINNDVYVHLDTLYRGCSVGTYCAIGKHAQAITAEAKTPLNVYYLESSYIEELAPYIPELREKLEEVKDFCQTGDLPMMDFRLFRLNRLVDPGVDIAFSIKLAIQRIKRFSTALKMFVPVNVLLELLKDVRKNNVNIMQCRNFNGKDGN